MKKKPIESAVDYFQMLSNFGKMEDEYRSEKERVMDVIKKFDLETNKKGMMISSNPINAKVKLASFGGMTGLTENIVLDRIEIGYDLFFYDEYQSFGFVIYLVLMSGDKRLRFYIARTEDALVCMTSCHNKELQIYSGVDNYLQLSDEDDYLKILGFCTEAIAEVNKNLGDKGKLLTHIFAQ